MRGTPIEHRTVAGRLGAAHVGSKYRFEDGDLLNEGAKVLEDLGLSVFKGYLSDPPIYYPFTDWGTNFETLIDVASHPYFRELFERDFGTYVLTTYSKPKYDAGQDRGWFRYEFTDEHAETVEESMYDVSRYFLETYDGTGKEFVLSIWEGDWAAAGKLGAEASPPDPVVLDRMKRMLSARHRGIVRARREIHSDVAVLHAVEINKVIDAMREDEPWIVNTILPDVAADLVSYSSWDLCGTVAGGGAVTADNRALVRETLDYIEDRAPEPNSYLRSVMGEGVRPIFQGEFGYALHEHGLDTTMQAVRTVTEESLAWGCPYVIFWQTYDNEAVIDGEVVSTGPDVESRVRKAFNGYADFEDVKGFYLIRPDGTRASTWYYFAALSDPNRDDICRLEIRFDGTVLESDVNPEVSPETARQLAFACHELEFRSGNASTTYDIGSRRNEPGIIEGAYYAEGSGDDTFRWFGGPNGRTTIYASLEEIGFDPDHLRVVGYGIDGGINATMSFDGRPVANITIEEGMAMYEISLDR